MCNWELLLNFYKSGHQLFWTTSKHARPDCRLAQNFPQRPQRPERASPNKQERLPSQL